MLWNNVKLYIIYKLTIPFESPLDLNCKKGAKKKQNKTKKQARKWGRFTPRYYLILSKLFLTLSFVVFVFSMILTEICFAHQLRRYFLLQLGTLKPYFQWNVKFKDICRVFFTRNFLFLHYIFYFFFSDSPRSGLSIRWSGGRFGGGFLLHWLLPQINVSFNEMFHLYSKGLFLHHPHHAPWGAAFPCNHVNSFNPRSISSRAFPPDYKSCQRAVIGESPFLLFYSYPFLISWVF